MTYQDQYEQEQRVLLIFADEGGSGELGLPTYVAPDLVIERARSCASAIARLDATKVDVVLIVAPDFGGKGLDILFASMLARNVPVILVAGDLLARALDRIGTRDASGSSSELVDDLGLEQFLRMAIQVAREMTSYEGLLHEARSLVSQRRFKAAEVAIRRSLSLNPISADGLNLLGVVSCQSGDWVGCQRYFRSALAFEPTHAAANENLRIATTTKLSESMRLE